MEVAIVVANAASSLIAVANSDSVSNRPGAELIKSLTALVTKLVEASCVVLVPVAALTAVGVPRRSTDSMIELDRALIKGILFFSLVRLLVKPY
jgi:hypothetical protein